MVCPSGLTSSDIQVPRVVSMGMSRDGPGGFWTSHLASSASVSASTVSVAGGATTTGAGRCGFVRILDSVLHRFLHGRFGRALKP